MANQELVADLAEISTLLQQATRSHTKNLLEKEERRLKQIIDQLAAKEVATSVSSTASTPSASTGAPLPTVKITNYGWDQSEKYVKIYMTLNGIHGAPADSITSNFTEKSFSLHINNFQGKNHVVEMIGLQYPIVAKDSLVKQKTDMLLVMLRKETDGKTWDDVTRIAADAKNKSVPKFDKGGSSGDPNESIMTMMKELYETGDDEMKRTIRKAWHEGQQKKNLGGALDGMDL